jgi:hypothetical protein
MHIFNGKNKDSLIKTAVVGVFEFDKCCFFKVFIILKCIKIIFFYFLKFNFNLSLLK